MTGEMVDSGAREDFASGAVRDSGTNKVRPDLISPLAELRLGEWCGAGAVKYTPWNWAKGIPASRCFESLKRHVAKYAAGMDDEDHVAAIMWNAMAIIHNEEAVKLGLLPEEMDDMPPEWARRSE